MRKNIYARNSVVSVALKNGIIWQSRRKGSGGFASLLFILMLIFCDGASEVFFEAQAEVLAVVVTGHFRDLIAFQVGGMEQLSSFFHADLNQVIVQIDAVLLFIQAGQVTVVDIKLVCDALQRQVRVHIFRLNIAADLIEQAGRLMAADLLCILIRQVKIVELLEGRPVVEGSMNMQIFFKPLIEVLLHLLGFQLKFISIFGIVGSKNKK